MNQKHDWKVIKNLNDQGFTAKEIALKLGIRYDVVSHIRKKMKLKINNYNRELKLKSKEISLIIGTVLGDSTIRYVYKGSLSPNLSFSHCIKQREYFMYKIKLFERLRVKWGEYNHQPNGLSKDKTFLQARSGNIPALIELREQFYINNVKVIPKQLIEKYFNKDSLYLMYMDDGSLDVSSGAFIINTHCFKREDLEWFTDFLKRKFNLDFNIKKDNSLYLRMRSAERFKKLLLSKHKVNSMTYKIYSHRKIPLNGETPVMDNPVLNQYENTVNA